MTRPSLLSTADRATWLHTHNSWEFANNAITRSFVFANFSDALAFVVQVGLAAERHDHHPDVTLSWGKASVLWATHDAGGVTELDTKLAALCDGYAAVLGTRAV
jgi:4a-hydroxytetrahydrobiopterin dehydratase